MPTNKDTLELTLPTAIIDLGRVVAAGHPGVRVTCRTGTPQPTAEQMDERTDKVTAAILGSRAARRLAGISQGQDESERRTRVRVLAYAGFQALGQTASRHVLDVSDLASACLDPHLPPTEAMLRARHVVGLMMAEDRLVGSGEANGPLDKARLPGRTLEWLAGGRRSMGFLTANKLVGSLLPKGFDNDEEDRADGRRESAPIPSAKELAARIAGRVVGLDGHVRALSSLLVMHLARAKMLRAGLDPGTSNGALLLAGSPGTGKTWLMECASMEMSCPIASMSASAMTSEGFVGGKLDDLFRALVAKAKGDFSAARFGVAFTDEWDAKAARGSHGREVTTTAIQHEFLVPMQGAEFLISGKRAMERPMTFNSRGTFFAFAGAFAGLREQIGRKAAATGLGFSVGTPPARRARILDALIDYGYLRAWVSRLTAVMFIPDPAISSLEKAAAGGVLDSFNMLLGELGIVLFPEPVATPRIAAYALESRTFFRGIKSVWWALAEQAVSSGERGLVVVTPELVDAAVGRIESGAATGEAAAPASGCADAVDQDGCPESGEATG